MAVYVSFKASKRVQNSSQKYFYFPRQIVQYGFLFCANFVPFGSADISVRLTGLKVFVVCAGWTRDSVSSEKSSWSRSSTVSPLRHLLTSNDSMTSRTRDRSAFSIQILCTGSFLLTSHWLYLTDEYIFSIGLVPHILCSEQPLCI